MLPLPTVEFVEDECRRFDEENSLGEDSLDQLRSHFPTNSDIRHVLLKVIVLNKLYGTMIRDIDVETVARNIVRLAQDQSLDQLLEQGALDAVFLITDCPGVKEYLSFASKFCSWHNPTAYPIYDGNVRECLWSYRQKDAFAIFKKDDLWYYRKFIDAIVAFRSHYNLTSLSFRQLDKFMYLAGRQILKQREEEAAGPDLNKNL